MLRTLAHRLPELWNAKSTDPKLKQRIAQLLIKEVVLDVDDEARESVALVHWAGGQHTELRVRRRRPPRVVKPAVDPADVVRRMAEYYADAQIALTLNRARRGKRTSTSTWTELRVRQLRESMGISPRDPGYVRPPMVTRDEAAVRLGICVGSVKKLIDEGILPAEQVAPFAPWQIPESALHDKVVLAGVQAVVERRPKNLDYEASTVLKLPEIT